MRPVAKSFFTHAFVKPIKITHPRFKTSQFNNRASSFSGLISLNSLLLFLWASLPFVPSHFGIDLLCKSYHTQSGAQKKLREREAEKGLKLSCLPLFPVSFVQFTYCRHGTWRLTRSGIAPRQADWLLLVVREDASLSLIMKHVIYSPALGKQQSVNSKQTFPLITFYDVTIWVPSGRRCHYLWMKPLFKSETKTFMAIKIQNESERANSKTTRFKFLMLRKLFNSVPGSCVTKHKTLRLTIVIWYDFSSLSKSVRELVRGRRKVLLVEEL